MNTRRKLLRLLLGFVRSRSDWLGVIPAANFAVAFARTNGPEGALVYIEGKDFAGLLQDWNSSPEKAQWIKSDNYSVFSNSRLFLR